MFVVGIEASGSLSNVRLKLALVWIVFLACWFWLKFGRLPPGAQIILFAVAGIDAVLVYFIRCERCHTPLLSLRPDSILRSWRVMFPQKRCPKCGLERY